MKLEWIPILIILAIIGVAIFFISSDATVSIILIILMLIGFGVFELVVGQHYSEQRVRNLNPASPTSVLTPEQQIEKAVTNALKAGIDPVDIKRIVVQALKNEVL